MLSKIEEHISDNQSNFPPLSPPMRREKPTLLKLCKVLQMGEENSSSFFSPLLSFPFLLSLSKKMLACLHAIRNKSLYEY